MHAEFDLPHSQNSIKQQAKKEGGRRLKEENVDDANRPLITIITAAFNVEELILKTAESIRNQSCKTAEWIIIDGGSNDGTIDLLQKNTDVIDYWISERDGGIYDALNKGIFLAQGTYYLVLGAGDTLAPDAIEKFSQIIRADQPDLITAWVKDGDRIIPPARLRNRRYLWLGHNFFCSSHSVGTCIKLDLHARHGLYSHWYALLADGKFIGDVLRSKDIKYSHAEFLSGEFLGGGATHQRRYRSACEHFMIQMESGAHVVPQMALLFLRLIKASIDSTRSKFVA